MNFHNYENNTDLCYTTSVLNRRGIFISLTFPVAMDKTDAQFFFEFENNQYKVIKRY